MTNSDHIDSEEIHKYVFELLDVSRKAGQAIMDVYKSENFSIDQKKDTSPLTQADLASNKIICEALAKISPEIPIISEENDIIPFEIRSKWKYCWVVDPLDGTKEFVNRNGEFTTNIGLVYKNKVVAGIVYLPVFDELYYAIEGSGAFEIKNNKTERLEAKSFKMSDYHLNVICSRSHLNEKTQNYIDKLSSPKLVNKGSSLKFITIAKGEADIYPRMAPTMEWDTCAAQIILEEAGGRVYVDGSDLAPLLYNKRDLKNPYFVATGKEVQ